MDRQERFLTICWRRWRSSGSWACRFRGIRRRGGRHGLLRAGGYGDRASRRVRPRSLWLRTSLGATPFFLFGTKRKKSNIWFRLRGEEALGLWPDRAQAGSDAGNVQTSAELRGGKWVINGTKAFITNSGTDITGGTTITAVTGNAPTVARDQQHHRAAGDAGIHAQPEVSQDGLARLRYARALSLPMRSARRRTCSARAAKGIEQFLTILDGGRISVAALSVGLAMGAYDEALSYAKERQPSASRSASFKRSHSSSSTCSRRSSMPSSWCSKPRGRRITGAISC